MKKSLKKIVFGLMFTLLVVDMLTFAFSVQIGKTEDINAKDVEDAINPAGEGSSRNFFSSYLMGEKNRATKNVLIAEDEWSALQTFFDFQNSSESWKKGAEMETKALYDSFRFDNDSVEIVVGLDRSTHDVTSVLSNLASEHEASIISEVSAGDETLAFIVDAPYETLRSFTSVLKMSNFVRYVEPNMRFDIYYSPNDPYWPLQWGPKKIGADGAWDIQVGSSDVLVAVIDTGIDWNHPDLTDNYVPLGYDWVNDDSDPMDDHGHGTHVAGVIAAVTNNSIGIAGVSQVKIMAEKGLNQYGYGYADDLANAIVHAVDQGANILSNSWGSFWASSLIHDAVRYAQDHGVLVLAAAGNSATSQKFYPAAFDEVVAVTATDSSDLPAWFTNFGDWVEVAAPGVDIYSTVWDDSYTYMSGTSMATPHAAGVAALIWSQFPNMTRDWVRLRLQSTADDLGNPGFDVYYGYGRINAKRAVEQAVSAHDLLISSLESPSFVEPGNTVYVNTTVSSLGTSNESDVTLQLLVNGSRIDSALIDFLASGTSATVGCSWSPMVEGTYNVTSYVLPAPGENITANNFAMKIVTVGFAKHVLWDDAHDGDGDSLTGNYFSLYQLLSSSGFVVDELTSGTINSGVLASYDILVLIDPEYNFSSSEISDIHDWVTSGGGLIVIPDAGYPPTLNTIMTPYGVQLTGMDTGSGTTTDIITHPITQDVGSIYYDRAWELAVSSPSETLAWTSEHYVFLSTTTGGEVVVVSDSNIMDNYGLGNADNTQLMLNMFNLIGIEYVQHELAVLLEAPAFLKPGDSALLNGTVYNGGFINETSIKLFLLINGTAVESVVIPNLANGTSYTIDYLWAPTAEGWYNVTAYAPPIQGEKVTINNFVSIMVLVLDIIPPTVSILSPEHGDIIASTNITVSWIGADNETGIDYYLVYLNRDLIINTTDTSCELIGLAEGFPPQNVIVTAHDKAGNLASDQVYFIVDATAPSVEILSPEDDYVTKETNITVVWTGSDNETRVAYYLVYLNDAQVLNTTTTSHALTGLRDSDYTVKIEAYDLAGNRDSDEITITVDITAPTASINIPPSGGYLKGMVVINVTGDDANLDRMELYIGGRLVATWTSNGTPTCYWDTTADSNGSYSVELKVYDKAGNMATETIMVTIDNTIPEAKTDSPAIGFSSYSYISVYLVLLSYISAVITSILTRCARERVKVC